MKHNEILGLRIFLLTILKLIEMGNKETSTFIEEKLSSGIASVLYKKYQSQFDSFGFNSDNIDNIDDYYKNFVGCLDGQESKYGFDSENTGLYLLVALALDEIF